MLSSPVGWPLGRNRRFYHIFVSLFDRFYARFPMEMQQLRIENNKMGGCVNPAGGNSHPISKGLKYDLGTYHLIIQQKIAEGAFGDVWKCKDRNNGRPYALKQIKIQSKELDDMFKRQTQCLQDLASIEGVVGYVSSQHKRGEQGVTGYILTEYIETTLLEKLRDHHYTPSQILTILKNMAKTLQEVHAKGYLHADIKAENILTQKEGQVYKLCDFGSCLKLPMKQLREMNARQKSQLKQYFETNSTFIYRAPEVINMTSEPLTSKIDIWMLGCVIYLLLFRKHPFEAAGHLAIVTGQVDYNLPIQGVRQQDRENKDLLIKCIQGMLQVNVSQRWDQERLLEASGGFLES